MATRGDDKAPVESFVVVTVEDTMAGDDVIVGNAVVATGGADPQMNCLLDCLEHMKRSWQPFVGKLRKEEENNV